MGDGSQPGSTMQPLLLKSANKREGEEREKSPLTSQPTNTHQPLIRNLPNSVHAPHTTTLLYVASGKPQMLHHLCCDELEGWRCQVIIQVIYQTLTHTP